MNNKHVILYKDFHCHACGWPVVFACNNEGFCMSPAHNMWDWWVYCSKKSCENHSGEGIFQDLPDWMEKDD